MARRSTQRTRSPQPPDYRTYSAKVTGPGPQSPASSQFSRMFGRPRTRHALRKLIYNTGCPAKCQALFLGFLQNFRKNFGRCDKTPSAPPGTLLRLILYKVGTSACLSSPPGFSAKKTKKNGANFIDAWNFSPYNRENDMICGLPERRTTGEENGPWIF